MTIHLMVQKTSPDMKHVDIFSLFVMTQLEWLHSCGGCAAVDGSWSAWQNWQDCNASCGDGWMVRKRYCNNPPPAYNGLDCGDDDREYQTCTNDCSGT